ncbi:MAG TPA: metallophosphoesterase, partial [Pyrinomonadaceae bacterium]|nr:metallophosphoesterase [Pyrinomonadaceae bacterium]
MTKTTNPDERKYEKPVAWLLGAQLIGRLKGALLYTAYGKKLDPRDWMTAEAVSFEDHSGAEFWFDYLSDTGDGTKAMYSMAYLALSNLWTKLDATTIELPLDEPKRQVSTLRKGTDFTFALPRGEFLFFGGDTAYHAAEYMTLFNRIQHPFNYAYLDLLNRKLISENEPRRPVFGIPGNHDYYDQLDGFRRQFRKPVRPEGPLPPAKSGGAFAQLTMAGFRRVQEASYVALRLPFEWWFWGLDTDSPSDRPGQNLDRRQEHFFRELAKIKPPDKLILATCTPSTVFGRIAREDFEKVAKPQQGLKIKRPFLPDKTTGKPDLKTTGDAKLTEGQCRLDLSGDVHQYARYWGPEAPKVPSEPPIRKDNSAPVPTATSYASVVSGLGGAFHHPSTTYDDEICEQVLYPSEAKSREAFANRLFKFWNVLTGGRVWVAGIVIAFTMYFGATVPPSSSQFLGNIGLLNRLHLTSPGSIEPTIISPKACDSVEPFWLWTGLGVAKDYWQPPANCKVTQPGYFFEQPGDWPLDLWLGELFIGISLIAIIVTLVLSVFTEKIFNDHSPFETGAEPEKKLWPIIIGNALLVIIGLFSIKPYREHITPFGSSLLVLFTIFAAITAIVLSIRYGEYRFQKSFVPGGEGNRWLEVACWLLAVAVVACGLWFFGKNNLAAFLISDILFVTVILLVLIATMLLPFLVAGDLLYTHSKPIRIIGKFLIGAWHL